MDTNSRQNHHLPAKSRRFLLAWRSPGSLSARQKFRVCFRFEIFIFIYLTGEMFPLIVTYFFQQVQKGRRKSSSTRSYEFTAAYDLPVNITNSTRPI